MADINWNGPNIRSVYLVTYFQAAETWTRETFANAVVSQFESAEARVRQWVCSQKHYQEGGIHFHIAIKLDHQKRWLRVRNELARVERINVNFSNGHTNYFDVWEYATKGDSSFLQSEGHLDLSAGFVPRTESAMNAKRSTSTAMNTTQQRTQGKRHFDALDLLDITVAKNIRSKNELLRLANEQKQEGKRDLSLYVLNNVEKCVKHTTWEMENVRREMGREAKTRMQLLREFCDVDCVVGCSGQWLECAKQTFEWNNYETVAFTEAVRLLLQMRRGKYRNILITIVIYHH